MAYTVIGIFEHDHQVDAALNQLVINNFKREDIDISTKKEIEGRGDPTDQNGTLGSKAGVYFMDIFKDENAALRYAAVAQTGVIMSVHTETYNSAVQAADIMDDCGAVNVNERARFLEDGMTRDERLSGQSLPETRNFPGIAEYDKDATPSQLENERISREQRNSVTRDRSSIVDRSERIRQDDYIDDPDSEYINPSGEEKREL